jgi:hypothetical protein
VEPREHDEAHRDDPVEGGALEEGGAGADRPFSHDEPVESGGLEDEPPAGDP